MNKTKKVELIILKRGLTYEQALDALRNEGSMITRPNWKGYHFRFFEHYGIRLANGEIIMNPEEIYDTDKNDWMIAKIENTDEIAYIYNQIKEIKNTLE